MKLSRPALLLAALQIALVCTIAVKYLHERHTCPRAWVQVTQYDPELVMRGRYLSLQPIVNVCGLSKTLAQHTVARPDPTWPTPESWEWLVHLRAENGSLIPVTSQSYTEGENDRGASMDDEQVRITWMAADPCEKATAHVGIEFYVPERTKSPFPLPAGQEAWLSVTIPPKGPPRGLQLATKQNGVLTPMNLN